MRPGIQPGIPAPHDLHRQPVLLQVYPVQVGNLQLAPRRRLDIFGNLDHVLVVEVQPGHGIAGLRLGRFFFQADCLALRVELDHAVTLRVLHVVGEHAGALAAVHGVAQQLLEVMAVIDVVAQHQRRQVVADEVFTNQEGLCQAVWRGLHGVGDVDAPLVAVAQQLLEAWGVLRGGNDQDVLDARQHQCGQRVVDHWFVVHRQQLLGNCQGRWMQAGTRPARQNDAFTLHIGHFSCISVSMRATPWRQSGKVRAKASCSLLVSRRELAGRLAGVG
ncbi:hypothetical protein D9M71_334340 [compost metagenome]